MSDEIDEVEEFESPAGWTFDWHKHERSFGGKEVFAAWLVIHVLSAPPKASAAQRRAIDRLMSRVSDESNRFHDLTITMQFNGIEVPTEYVLGRIDQVMDWAVGRKALELLNEQLRYDEITEAYQDAIRAARENLRTKFAELGIEVPDRDEDW